GMSAARAGCGIRLCYCSDAAALGRAAAVVRLRRHVLDRAHLEAGGLQRADRGLAARARALDEHVDLLDTVLLGLAGSGLRGHAGGVRGGLARALEAHAARGRPADDGARRVGDRDDRVVERRLDVGVAQRDVLLLLATRLARGGLGLCHLCSLLNLRARDYLRPAFFLPATVRLGPLRVRAFVLVR